MNSFCGADCENCGYGKSKRYAGCAATGGCPFGAPCFIAGYIRTGGHAAYDAFAEELKKEIDALGVPGLPKITEFYLINGAYVNLDYPLPGGGRAKFLDDSAVYLATQVECEFNDGREPRCFGVVADPTFLLVAEYGENGVNPEIVYKKR